MRHRLPQLLLSRFLINLREAAEQNPSDDTAMQHFSRFSVPGFRVPTSTIDRVVGNLGESLEFRDHDLEDEDDAEHHVESQRATVEDHALDAAEVSLSAWSLRENESVC